MSEVEGRTVPVNHACETCAIYNAAQLKKMGVDMEKWDHVIALAGNPNTGKSTVFNALTGLRQHTGNWPGKTVTRAEGGFEYNGRNYKIVDLPGTYSLLSTSPDEETARDFILFGKPDATIVVVDATRLERNLNLLLQILEITDRVVVCLNLIDEARRHGINVDDRALARELGVPVVPASARYGKGLPELLETMADVVSGAIPCKPYRIKSDHDLFNRAIDDLGKQIQSVFPGMPNTRWLAMRLLDGDKRIYEALRSGELEEMYK